MLILVEGVDGSGKTTLCNQLQSLGVTVVSPVDRLEMFAYSKWFKLSQVEGVIVVDRSFITELVYRTVDGKQRGSMSLKEIVSVLDYCKIVLCETDSAFEDSMKRGEDNIVDDETSRKLQYTYRIIISMLSKFTSAKMTTYNWKKQNVADVLKFICED